MRLKLPRNATNVIAARVGRRVVAFKTTTSTTAPTYLNSLQILFRFQQFQVPQFIKVNPIHIQTLENQQSCLQVHLVLTLRSRAPRLSLWSPRPRMELLMTPPLSLVQSVPTATSIKHESTPWVAKVSSSSGSISFFQSGHFGRRVATSHSDAMPTGVKVGTCKPLR